jgi:hypothetical protein
MGKEEKQLKVGDTFLVPMIYLGETDDSGPRTVRAAFAFRYDKAGAEFRLFPQEIVRLNPLQDESQPAKAEAWNNKMREVLRHHEEAGKPLELWSGRPDWPQSSSSQ